MADSKELPLSEARLKTLRELLSDERETRTKKASREYGKSLRKAVPRDVFSFWQPPVGRSDAADLIFEQDLTRVPGLVSIRHERMAVSPFTFYRGAALVMAQDLQSLPTTGIEVQAVGDAHIANFGFFLSPERRLVFDVNDFDETARGPWEWDVARLAASVEICGRERKMTEDQRVEAVLACVQGYREAMRTLSSMGNLDVWYVHADVDILLELFGDKISKKGRKKADKAFAEAKKKGSVRAVQKYTEVVDGHLKVVNMPPEVVPLGDLAAERGFEVADDLDWAKVISVVLQSYRRTLSPERAHLLESYRGCDIARKVVGVGSVGMRAWIVVLKGADVDDPLVLQVKEAGESVLERYVGKAAQANHGQRVVEGQHAMQAASDIFLGWTSLPGVDGKMHDYYVRQLWDGKGSVDLETISAKRLKMLAQAAAVALAHAHARTGDRLPSAPIWGARTSSIAPCSRSLAATPSRTSTTTRRLSNDWLTPPNSGGIHAVLTRRPGKCLGPSFFAKLPFDQSWHFAVAGHGCPMRPHLLPGLVRGRPPMCHVFPTGSVAAVFFDRHGMGANRKRRSRSSCRSAIAFARTACSGRDLSTMDDRAFRGGRERGCRVDGLFTADGGWRLPPPFAPRGLGRSIG